MLPLQTQRPPRVVPPANRDASRLPASNAFLNQAASSSSDEAALGLSNARRRVENAFRLQPLFNWITLIDPIRREIIGHHKYAQAREAHAVQGNEGGANVRAISEREHPQ